MGVRCLADTVQTHTGSKVANHGDHGQNATGQKAVWLDMLLEWPLTVHGTDAGVLSRKFCQDEQVFDEDV